MPIEELTFLYTLLEATDRLYGFWLTGTFALVLASFYISERMTTQLFSILLITYLAFATTMMLRYWAVRTRIFETVDFIRATYPDSANTVGPFATWFEMLSFFIGTIGAIYYLVHCYGQRRDV